MTYQFFKASPEPEANIEWPATPIGDVDPPFVLVALERTNDPDANNHTGFDFFGAYGDDTAIDNWAATQTVVKINQNELPKPVTFYPAPFNQIQP